MRSWERPAPGVFLYHDVNTTLENIKVHYAEGMGLLAQVSENITLDGFSVCLKGRTIRVFHDTGGRYPFLGLQGS